MPAIPIIINDDALHALVTAEATARANGDTALANSIAAEITARTNADTAEASARAAGDTAAIAAAAASAALLYDPLTQNRPNNATPDLSLHYFPLYDPGDAQSEKADGVSIKSWLSGEFDALGAAAAAQAAAATDATTKANAAQAAAISAAATDATTKANAAQAAAIAASQPLDADLTAIAALTPSNDDIIQRKAGAWTNRSLAQYVADLASGILGTLLTGLSVATSTAVAATDSILVAFGKLQAFNNLFTTLGLALARLANFGAVGFIRINADNTATARTAAEMRTDLDVPANGEAILKTFVAAKGDIIGASANDTPAITSVGTDGQLLMANSANASGLGYAWKTFVQPWVRGSTTITNIPAAITWFPGGTGTTRQQPYSLAGYKQIKIDVFVTTLFAGAGSGICLRYRSTYSATETDYSILGSGSTEVLSPISTANDWNTSGWIDITAAALTDVYIGVFTINGNGTSDPIISQVILSLR